jgi:nitroreductase
MAATPDIEELPTMDSLAELIVRNRSYRRFAEARRIPRETLVALVDLARCTASGGNRQPLKYILLHTEADCATLFPHLRWAALLKGWVPQPGERPAAYLLMLADREIMKNPLIDAGIAAQSILLAACERGLGGCMLGAIDRPAIQRVFGVPDQYEILLVLALGKPAERCLLEDAPNPDAVGYYRDAQDVHHVPKRPLAEVIVDFRS